MRHIFTTCSIKECHKLFRKLYESELSICQNWWIFEYLINVVNYICSEHIHTCMYVLKIYFLSQMFLQNKRIHLLILIYSNVNKAYCYFLTIPQRILTLGAKWDIDLNFGLLNTRREKMHWSTNFSANSHLQKVLIAIGEIGLFPIFHI